MYEFTYYEVPKVKTRDSVEYNNFNKFYKQIAESLGISTSEYLKQNNIVFEGEKLKYPGHEFRQGYKYIVYALTKPETNLLYIGITSHSLEWIYSQHLKKSTIENFDTSWDINFIKLTNDIDEEKHIIYHYLNNPNYILINKIVYKKLTDPEFDKKLKEKLDEYNSRPEIIERIRNYNQQDHVKEYKNNYQKTSQHAKEYRADYYKYYKKAKLEGLTVNEYKMIKEIDNKEVKIKEIKEIKMANKKIDTQKDKVINFVKNKKEASFTEIQRYLVDAKYGIGTYDANRKKYRGYYSSLFSSIDGSPIASNGEQLYKKSNGKYSVVRSNQDDEILDIKSTHFEKLPNKFSNNNTISTVNGLIFNSNDNVPLGGHPLLGLIEMTNDTPLDLSTVYKEIVELGNSDKCTISENVCKFLEETGEFIREINKTTGRKTTNETIVEVQNNILEEAADTLQNLLLITSAFNISPESLLKMVRTKNVKWKSKIADRQNFVKNKSIISPETLRNNGWVLLENGNWGKEKNMFFDYFKFTFNISTGYVAFENMLARKVETIEQLEQYYNVLKS